MKKILPLPPLLLLFAAATLVHLSCAKEPAKTTLSGRVIEYGTAEPVPDAQVFVISQEVDPFGPSVSVIADSFRTAADGTFHREYLNDDLSGGEYVSVYKPGFRYEKDLPFHNGENNLEVVLRPYAWLKLKTVPDLGESYIDVDVEIGYWLTYDSVTGDTTRIFEILGNRYVNIRWIPYSNTSILYKDSIYCPGGDTTYYELHF